MKRIISLLLTAVMLSGLVFAMVSCGDESEPVGGGAQISVYLGGAVYDFDPQTEYTDDSALSIISLLFEPLFRIDDDGDLRMAMAKSYDVNKKKGTVTIKLKESFWNDGTTQVKASDFLYSWQRLIKCSNSNPAAALLYDVKNALAVKSGEKGLDDFGVRVVNNTTLEITLEEGFTDYTTFLRNLANVALSPLNSIAVNGKEEYWSKKLSTISSNGPFKLSIYDLDSGTFTVERNKGYHRPLGSNATVDAYVTPYLLKTIWNVELPESDPDYISNPDYLDSLLTELTEKTVFYVGDLSCAKRVEYKNNNKVKVSDLLSTYCYAFNENNPLFADAAVRRIMANVIDRNAILQLVTFGRVATGLIAPGVANGSKITSSFRNSDSNILSAAATLSINDAKAQLQALSYTPGEFDLTYKGTEANDLIAKYVADLWTQLGFTVHLKPVISQERGFDDGGYGAENLFVSDPSLQYAYETGNFDVIAIDYQMYTTDALVALAALTSNMNGNGIDVGSGEGITVDGDGNRVETYELRGNRLGYKNESYDAKVKAAYDEKNPNKRAALLHEAEAILLGDMPVIPLLFNQSFHVVSGELTGVSVDWAGRVSFTGVSQKNYQNYLPTQTTTAASTENGDGE